jgi:5-deoxy-glucuronate isomerase
MKHVVRSDETSSFRQEITPESAGWKYLTFHLHTMNAGETYEGESLGRELIMVFLSGSAAVGAGSHRWEFTGRDTPFQGLPHALYVPPRHSYIVEATTPLEVAVAFAPAEGRHPVRFITPEDVRVEIRGGHNVTRQITHLVDPGQAEKLLCVEVYTPSGNWSSYPPHKHDVQNPPEEVKLEEIYHYRLNPPDGWALQRLYNDERSLDEVVLVHEGDTVLVREGYHPVVAAPGYDAYYLNFLAGETPSWIAKDEPRLAWVRGQWEGGPGRLKLPLGRDKPDLV